MDRPISEQTIGRRQRTTRALIAGALLTLTLGAWGINRAVGTSVALGDLRVVEVHRGSIANTINASGVVVPVHEEQVPSPIQTKVSRVHVKAGQEVKAGEL